MPKIVVHRETEWANKARKVAIFLNGKKLGTIEDRQVIAFEVPEGEQELVAKIDWCRSNKLMLHLQPDELEHVKIEGFVFSSYFFPVSMLILLIYLGVYFTTGVNNVYLAAAVMCCLGYLLFFLSVGRKHYLQLKIK
ncbi:MAG: hypothetical protein ABGW91_04135 [Christiangramia sp.]|nr:hypothetical protein [Christiangramia sp.]|tara:strand:+ start:422 stop:832 length:411 start_codon:yes stop_codon:yes gene_type:complete